MKPFPLLFLLALTFGAEAQEPAFKLARTIPLPGVKGRFDHFASDGKGRRVFVAALGNDTVEVFDSGAGRRLETIPGCSKPQGVLFLPEINQLFVANGEDGTVKNYDAVSFKLLGSLASLDDADNVRSDPVTKLVYVGFGDGALGVIDASAFKLTGSIKLAGHPESFQLEREGKRIFVNVPDAHHVAVVDREKRRVVATWPLREFKANFPMAFDETNHRLFIGCRAPARLVVLDTADGSLRAHLPISGDTDDLFYDAKRKRLYFSCGEGFIDVIDQLNPDEYRLRERIQTAPGARTSFFAPESGEYYLAVPQRGDQAAELRIFRVQP